MVGIEDIYKILLEKNPSAISSVRRAYELAEYAHRGVVRESGDPYITHPLCVVKNLLNMEIYDADTLCAALLHDVVEDTNITLQDITNEINPTVAELVDGVTKISRMNFSSKEQQKFANTRKIINGLNKDVRIILIKLADRLHNMQTLEYKKEEKQRDNARETMELFVPLALSIGAYRIKGDLEDLALKYLEPDRYNEIRDKMQSLSIKELSYLGEITDKLKTILNSKNIPNDIILRTMNICSVYKKIIKGYEFENIYDLFYFKVLVQEVEDCYRTLAEIHRNNPPINGRFKDYIYNPRTNHYQSLHTTVFGDNGKLIKAKVRTFDMDKVAAFGLCAYWNIPEDKKEGEIPYHKTKEEIQQQIRHKLQFAQKLKQIDDHFENDYDFIKAVKKHLLTEHVYVYADSDEEIELPLGSTALDFACQVCPELLDQMTGVIINEKRCPVNTVLQNNDHVQILTKGKVVKEEFQDIIKIGRMKRKVKSLMDRQNHQSEL